MKDEGGRMKDEKEVLSFILLPSSFVLGFLMYVP